MTHLRTAWIVAFLMAFLPVVAFASQQHKTLQLDQKAYVGNQQLKPGRYKMEFNDNGKTTEVEFLHDGKKVVTAPAQVMHKKDLDNAMYEINTANGRDVLDRVYVNNKEELAFGKAVSKPMHSSQNANKPTS